MRGGKISTVIPVVNYAVYFSVPTTMCSFLCLKIDSHYVLVFESQLAHVDTLVHQN